jgi:hypothetical protein
MIMGGWWPAAAAAAAAAEAADERNMERCSMFTSRDIEPMI